MTTPKNRKRYSYRLSKRITRVAKVWVPLNESEELK